MLRNKINFSNILKLKMWKYLNNLERLKSLSKTAGSSLHMMEEEAAAALGHAKATCLESTQFLCTAKHCHWKIKLMIDLPKLSKTNAIQPAKYRNQFNYWLLCWGAGISRHYRSCLVLVLLQPPLSCFITVSLFLGSGLEQTIWFPWGENQGDCS